MSYLENLSDGEYETVVAATAYAITTLEDEEDSSKQRKTVEGLTRTKSKLEEKPTGTSFNWSFKWLSGKEAEHEEKQTGKVEKAARENDSSRYIDVREESDASPPLKKTPTFTKKYPNEKAAERVQSGKAAVVGTKATSTKKPAGFSSGYKSWDEDSKKLDKREAEAEADAWEKAKMIKARDRYERMMSVISEWQTEKKAKAKRRLEKKQGGPEHKVDKAWKHYNNEISRINQIAGNARALAKERLQNDEMKIREKAAKIRSTGKAPGTYCACC